MMHEEEEESVIESKNPTKVHMATNEEEKEIAGPSTDYHASRIEIHEWGTEVAQILQKMLDKKTEDEEKLLTAAYQFQQRLLRCESADEIENILSG